MAPRMNVNNTLMSCAQEVYLTSSVVACVASHTKHNNRRFGALPAVAASLAPHGHYIGSVPRSNPLSFVPLSVCARTWWACRRPPCTRKVLKECRRKPAHVCADRLASCYLERALQRLARVRRAPKPLTYSCCCCCCRSTGRAFCDKFDRFIGSTPDQICVQQASSWAKKYDLTA